MYKNYLLLSLFLCLFCRSSAQTVIDLGPDGYKTVDIGGGLPDYAKSVILLHEIYNGTLIDKNFAIGTITAKRGAAGSLNRIAVAQISSSSAYNGTSATLHSTSSDVNWKLRTCIYNGKKYMALEVPYLNARYAQGFFFTGWRKSTGESLKCVSYDIQGVPQNTSLISDIQDYTDPQVKEAFNAASLQITGKVGIGTANFSDALNVNGTIHSKEVKVDLNGWSDFVFNKDYPLLSLDSLRTYLVANHHLPELPSEAEVLKDGVPLGDLNKRLLQKIEELTLYLFQKDEEIKSLQTQMQLLKERIE